MSTLAERIIRLLETNPGLTDREITDSLEGHSAPQQPVNQKCHALKQRGLLARRKRSDDGLIGNYLVGQKGDRTPNQSFEIKPKPAGEHLSEDEVKKYLENWLIGEGWQVQVAWGHSQGVDIKASQGTMKWVIEVKGGGSLQPMRVNYFLGVIGELLQRMDEPDTSYSIAFPDIQQFKGLWERLPALAKQRTKITALFVDRNGKVVHLEK